MVIWQGKVRRFVKENYEDLSRVSMEILQGKECGYVVQEKMESWQ